MKTLPTNLKKTDKFSKISCTILYFVSMWPVGDSMSKVREKRLMSKVFFLNEMWKIIRQIDDFGSFLNIFCNFGVFLAKNQKTQKILFWKSENRRRKKSVFVKDWTTYFKYHIYLSYSMNKTSYQTRSSSRMHPLTW